MSTEIVTALISSIVGGLMVAVLNYLFARKKTEAEIEKLRAEADKIKVEAEKVRTEITNLGNTVEKARLETNERTIYDGTKGISGYDVEIDCKHSFKDGAIITDGVKDFRLRLKKYICDDNLEREFLPKNNLLAGKRKVRVSCEAKVTITSCNLLFQLKPFRIKGTLFGQTVNLPKDEWTKIDLYFRYDTDWDTVLSIIYLSDQDLMALFGSLDEGAVETLDKTKRDEGSIQIRNLVLAEYASKN